MPTTAQPDPYKCTIQETTKCSSPVLQGFEETIILNRVTSSVRKCCDPFWLQMNHELSLRVFQRFQYPVSRKLFPTHFSWPNRKPGTELCSSGPHWFSDFLHVGWEYIGSGLCPHDLYTSVFCTKIKPIERQEPLKQKKNMWAELYCQTNILY